MLYIILSIGFLILIFTIISETLLKAQFQDLSQRHIIRDIELVHKLLSAENDRLAQLNKDWGAWDETYEFIQGKDPDYKKRNLIPETFVTLDLGFIIYFDLKGNVVYAGKYEPETGNILPLNQETVRKITDNLYNDILRQYLNKGTIAPFENQPYVLSAESILTSTHKGPLMGWLVMGRKLNLKAIMELTNLWIYVKPIDSTRICAYDFNPEEHTVSINTSKGDTLSASHKFYDVLNEQMIMVNIAEKNEILRQGKRVSKYIIFLVITFGLIIIASSSVFLNNAILQPLIELSKQFKKIDLDRIENKIALSETSAEFNTLAENINNMLMTIKKQKQEILEKELRYRDLVENAEVGILVDDLAGNVVYFNEKLAGLFGYKLNEFARLKPEDYIHPEDLKLIREYHRRRLNEEEAPARYEIKGIGKNKRFIDLEVHTVLLKKDGKIIGTRNYIMDITERKKAEEQLNIQSMTDELTGLLNRRGFKSFAQHQLELAKKIKKGFYLFYCDLNDMKKINDKFGHYTGDWVLKELSNILKNSFRKTDIIARVGGDEFIVLAPEAIPESLNVMLNRLNANIDKFNVSNNSHKISLSIGYAYFNPDESKTLDEIIEIADKKMYEEKIKLKNKVIDSY